jgi:hypothetical protein
MSQQAPCRSEALVSAACTVSVGEHMVIPHYLGTASSRGSAWQVIANRSPNRFHSKPLFSNDIRVSIFSGAARIEALTLSGQAMWRTPWSHLTVSGT